MKYDKKTVLDMNKKCQRIAHYLDNENEEAQLLVISMLMKRFFDKRNFLVEDRKSMIAVIERFCLQARTN